MFWRRKYYAAVFAGAIIIRNSRNGGVLGGLKSLIQYFLFVHELEQTLQRHVDVVTTEIEDKRFLSEIMKEGIVLYEE